MKSSSRPRIVVTGARGRLASLIADFYRPRDCNLELYSREPGDEHRSLADLLHKGDLSPHDTVLHLAWSTLPATSEQNPGSEDVHDLPLLSHLAHACAQREAHFVFFSSGGTVYGNAGERPSSETDPCRPIGAYGRAKLAAERIIQDSAAKLGLPSTILRISNPYGYPVPSGRSQGVIAHAVRCAFSGETLPLWGDGHALKDFLHYTDFLAALDRVVHGKILGTFNLSSGRSHRVRDILELVENHTGHPVVTAELPAPTWDVQDSRLDNSKFIAATGWQPAVSLDEGIRRFASGYHSR